MKAIQDVIDKAVVDPEFASQLKQDAKAAQAAGTESPEWEKLQSHFASSPDALTPDEGSLGWTTILTVTSVECTSTTTTTGR